MKIWFYFDTPFLSLFNNVLRRGEGRKLRGYKRVFDQWISRTSSITFFEKLTYYKVHGHKNNSLINNRAKCLSLSVNVWGIKEVTWLQTGSYTFWPMDFQDFYMTLNQWFSNCRARLSSGAPRHYRWGPRENADFFISRALLRNSHLQSTRT